MFGALGVQGLGLGYGASGFVGVQPNRLLLPESAAATRSNAECSFPHLAKQELNSKHAMLASMDLDQLAKIC